jgi:acylphosphatase
LPFPRERIFACTDQNERTDTSGVGANPADRDRKDAMTSGEKSIHRATVTFSGHVQGVGFRYTVLQAVRGFEVTGFVQNLPDGRVLLVAEGEKPEVDGLVTSATERMIGFIRSTERHDEVGVRRHLGFGIR